MVPARKRARVFTRALDSSSEADLAGLLQALKNREAA